MIRPLIVFQSFIQEESKEAQLFDSAVQRYQLRETGRFIQVKDEITGLLSAFKVLLSIFKPFTLFLFSVPLFRSGGFAPLNELLRFNFRRSFHRPDAGL